MTSFTPEYESAEDCRRADAIRRIELIARYHGIDLELRDDTGETPVFRLIVSAGDARELGKRLIEAGLAFERARRKRG